MLSVADSARPALASGQPLVLGCRLDTLTLEETVAAIERAIAAGGPCQHMSVNAAKLVRLQDDPVLAAAVARSELVTADGQAVVWAARLLGRPVPERVTGIDLMDALLARAEQAGYGVYVLGARQEVLHAALAKIRERHPALRVVGSHHGYFARYEEADVVERIRADRPDILLVALETPAKELFLARNRERLAVPFVMGVGGAIDILAGVRRRAPRLLQRLGLEWLYRLAQDPRRLARRYIVGNTVFTWLVLRAVLSRRGGVGGKAW
jgi:N-acetylglucosaminyldiphosphoundecaprenol N-acetyl-beta-D-mannosaminyltransferase